MSELNTLIDEHRGRERGMVCDEGELWCDGCKVVIRADDWAGHLVQVIHAAGYSILRPVTAEEEAANVW